MDMEKKHAGKYRFPGKVRTEIRVTIAIWEKLEQQAKLHHRSANGEINAILEEYFKQKEDEAP